MFKIVFLEFYYNLSDVQVVKQLNVPYAVVPLPAGPKGKSACILISDSLVAFTQSRLPTVSSTVNYLIKHNLVKETGKEAFTGGRRSKLIEFNPKAYFVVGVSNVQKKIRRGAI